MERVLLVSKFNQRGFIRGKIYNGEKFVEEEESVTHYRVEGEDGQYLFMKDSKLMTIDIDSNFEEVPEGYVIPKVTDFDLSNVTTSDLVDELKIREGVPHVIEVAPYEPYQINKSLINQVEDTGSAIILVVID